MTKRILRNFCITVFGSTAVGGFLIARTPGLSATNSSTVKDNSEWQCGREQNSKTINVVCPPYNAVPDDTQDDAKAFQSAVDSLPSSGGVIRIPPGTYLFNRPFIIQKPVHLLGAGPATILSHQVELSAEGQANFIRIGGATFVTENVTISDLTMQGPERSSFRTPMVRIVNNVEGVKIRNVGFKNVSSTCVLLFGSNIKNIEVSDNRADEFYEQFVELASASITGVHIERNVAKSTRGHPKLGPTQPFGVVFEPKIPGEINDVAIGGNSFSFDGMSMAELVNTGGVSLSRGPTSPLLYRRILIKDNIIRTTGVGIRVELLRSGGASAPGSVDISGNRIEGTASHGIVVTGGKDLAHRDVVSITGNIIRGYSAQAYYQYDGIRLEGNLVEPEIRGNQILPLKDDAQGIGRYGISIEPGVKKPVITDNKVAGYRDGAISNKSTSESVGK
jgi:hypothetical protein